MEANNVIETGQFLTFKLDNEEFALDILQVREVLDYTTVTRVPRTPEFMRGVINLRGSVVPVIDLRMKFGMPRTEQTVDTCVVIVELMVDGQPLVVGALADSVQEVMELEANDVEPTPRIGMRLDTQFIKGMGKRDDKFIIILDIVKVFSVDELAMVQEKGESLTVEDVAISA